MKVQNYQVSKISSAQKTERWTCDSIRNIKQKNSNSRHSLPKKQSENTFNRKKCPFIFIKNYTCTRYLLRSKFHFFLCSYNSSFCLYFSNSFHRSFFFTFEFCFPSTLYSSFNFSQYSSLCPRSRPTKSYTYTIFITQVTLKFNKVHYQHGFHQ